VPLNNAGSSQTRPRGSEDLSEIIPISDISDDMLGKVTLIESVSQLTAWTFSQKYVQFSDKQALPNTPVPSITIAQHRINTTNFPSKHRASINNKRSERTPCPQLLTRNRANAHDIHCFHFPSPRPQPSSISDCKDTNGYNSHPWSGRKVVKR
jgi:hypothetical protein